MFGTRCPWTKSTSRPHWDVPDIWAGTSLQAFNNLWTLYREGGHFLKSVGSN